MELNSTMTSSYIFSPRHSETPQMNEQIASISQSWTAPISRFRRPWLLMIQHLATDHATACALSPQTANCMSHLDFHSSPPVHSDKFSNSPRENIFMLSPHQAFQSHQVFKGRIQSQLPFLNTLFHISDRTAAPVSKKEGGITICLLVSFWIPDRQICRSFNSPGSAKKHLSQEQFDSHPSA